MSMSECTQRIGIAAGLALLLATGPAGAYPGGTPDFVTDVAPFCAACHSSISVDALAGAGERAEKEVAATKHLALIRAGDKGYGELSEAERATLVQHIQALDAASTIEVEHPPQVAPGETFQITVRLAGGAGPVVGLALVDRAHRWYARPASAVGWKVVGAPTIIGSDGQPQKEWLERRPERFDRGVTFVNVTGIESDASTGSFASAKVIFNLQAPKEPGNYPLVGAYLYGTEKGSPLGYTVSPLGYQQTRGGYTGKSGRVKFSEPVVITVKPGAAAGPN